MSGQKTAPFMGTDREYTLSPLTHADWQSLRTYLKYRPYYQLKEEARELPELEARLSEVLTECSKRTISMDDLQKQFMELDVITETVYLSVRKFHKDIGREQISQSFNVTNLADALLLIMDLSGVPMDDDEKKAMRGKAKR